MSLVAAPLWQTRSGQSHLVLLGLAVLFAVNLTLALFDTPPLIDWPNHLARHLLQCGAPGAENIARYYAYDFRIVPNLSSDILHTLPIACIDPELTQKVLIQVSSFGLVVATVLLHRAIWQVWSVWPLASALIAHHMAWAYGFENFILAAPFTILALALWFRLERHGPLITLAALWPVAVAIYVLHLYAFGFMMMAVGLLELQRVRDDAPLGWRVRRCVLSLALLLVIAAGPATHLVHSIATSQTLDVGGVVYIGLPGVVMTVLSPFAGYGNVLTSSETLAMAGVLLCTMASLVYAWRRAGVDMHVDRRVAFAAPVLIGVTLMVPFSFSSVAFTNIRFTVLLAALMIAATSGGFRGRSAGVFLTLVTVIFAAKVGWIASHWAEHDAEVTELREIAAEALGPDDRLLVAREDLSQTVRLHSHSAYYITRDRGTFWTGFFTGGNSLSPRPAFADRDHTQPFPGDWRLFRPEEREDPTLFPAPHYLHNWETFYTHILVLRRSGTPSPAADVLGDRVATGTFFDIYRIVDPGGKQTGD